MACTRASEALVMSVPEIKLVFDEPVQRKKIPKHLADYSPEERRELAKSLGFPGREETSSYDSWPLTRGQDSVCVREGALFPFSTRLRQRSFTSEPKFILS